MNSFENLKNVEHAPGVGYYDVPVEYARQDQINIWDEEQKQDKYNFNFIITLISLQIKIS